MRSLFWRLILLAPLFLLFVLFALSNTAPARIGLWPTDLVVEAPLSLSAQELSNATSHSIGLWKVRTI